MWFNFFFFFFGSTCWLFWWKSWTRHWWWSVKEIKLRLNAELEFLGCSQLNMHPRSYHSHFLLDLFQGEDMPRYNSVNSKANIIFHCGLHVCWLCVSSFFRFDDMSLWNCRGDGYKTTPKFPSVLSSVCYWCIQDRIELSGWLAVPV